MSETTTAALEAVPQEALEAVNRGSISWKSLAELLTKGRRPERVQRPNTLPIPAEITETQLQAMKHLLEIFGKVVPTERRALEDAEVGLLIDERLTLDTIKDMAETRIGHIRTTVLNHMDVVKERDNEGKPFIDDAGYYTVLVDKDGHYIPDEKVQIGVPNMEKVFSWERRNSSPDIDLSALQAMADDPHIPEITHEDWLAMTEQVRVFSEHKAMLHLKKHPKLLAVLDRVAKAGTAGGSFNMRKAPK